MICLCYFELTQGQLTYGKIGEWRFDKRSYLQSPPPRNLSLPPPGVPESVVCAQYCDVRETCCSFVSINDWFFHVYMKIKNCLSNI
jgi:hypothetical protein